MKSLVKLAVLAVALAAAPVAALAEGDAANGEKIFNRCKTCHMVGDNAKNRVGPVLTGVVGRKAGTAEGYKYSKLNLAAGEAGLVWTEENLMAYLPNATTFLVDYLKANGAEAKGRSKMVFALKKEQDRMDVIAYLKTFSTAAAEEPAKAK